MPVTTKHEFKVDLVRKKPNPKLLQIGNTEASVTIELITKEKPPPIVMKRIVDRAVTPVVEKYQKTLDTELAKLQAKMLELIKKGNAKAAEQMVADTAVSVNGAVKGLNNAVAVAVNKQLADDKRSNSLLLEAQIKVGVEITIIVLKVSTDVARLVASSGADIMAYKGLAENVYKLGKIVQEETKGEPAVRQDFLKTIGGYTTTKQRTVIKLEQEAKKKNQPFKLQDPKVVKAIGGALKPEAAKVEAARKKYKNKTTKMRHSLESLSAEAVKVEKTMKAAKDLKRGVQVGAKLMTLKGTINKSYARLTAAEKFADDMAMLLTEAGIKMDDRTFTERLKSADVTDWLKLGKEVGEAVKGLVEELV